MLGYGPRWVPGKSERPGHPYWPGDQGALRGLADL